MGPSFWDFLRAGDNRGDNHTATKRNHPVSVTSPQVAHPARMTVIAPPGLAQRRSWVALQAFQQVPPCSFGACRVEKREEDFGARHNASKFF